MDTFFTQKYCDRCGGDLSGGRTMSMYNTECICMACKRKERERADYKAACDAEIQAVRNGVKNYQGIESEGKKGK